MIKSLVMVTISLSFLFGCGNQEVSDPVKIEAKEQEYIYKDNKELVAHFLSIAELDKDNSRKDKLIENMFSEGSNMTDSEYESIKMIASALNESEELRITISDGDALIHKGDIEEEDIYGLIEMSETSKGWKIKEIYVN